MKMKPTKQIPLNESDLQAVGFKLNSIKLIQLVRRNVALYDRDAEGYTDNIQRELIWERILKQLFPKYKSQSKRIKQLIRNSVQRRWKTLRNAIAREVKRSATVENYKRMQENPILAQLKFLIPYINTVHCAKLTNKLGLRGNYHFTNETKDNDDVWETDEELDYGTDSTSSDSEMVSSDCSESRSVDKDDEDRMFLLSLVPDLKRIPKLKKPFIKAKIAKATSKGLNY